MAGRDEMEALKPSVVVVGAGAAGLVAAAFAAAAGAKVTLIERTKDGGRKILISGGGRCNVLAVGARARTLRHRIRRRTCCAHAAIVAAARTARLLRRRPRHSAGARRGIRQAVSAIESRPRRARRAGDVRAAQGRRRCSSTPRSPTCRARPAGFALETSGGAIECDRVVLATGGLSVPATGSDGIGLRIAQALGHDMIDTYPALTPLLAGDGPSCVAVRRLVERAAAREGRIASRSKRTAASCSRIAATAVRACSTSRTSPARGESPAHSRAVGGARRPRS